LGLHVGNIFSKDDGEATIVAHIRRENSGKTVKYGRVQVPVNVAVEEPWPRVIGVEADRKIVASLAHAHDVADDGIVKVVGGISSATDHMEGVSVQVKRMLYKDDTRQESMPSEMVCEKHPQVHREHQD